MRWPPRDSHLLAELASALESLAEGVRCDSSSVLVMLYGVGLFTGDFLYFFWGCFCGFFFALIVGSLNFLRVVNHQAGGGVWAVLYWGFPVRQQTGALQGLAATVLIFVAWSCGWVRLACHWLEGMIFYHESSEHCSGEESSVF